MRPLRQWKLGEPGGLLYGAYDVLRRRLNRRLVRRLGEALPGAGAVVIEAGSGTGYASSLLTLDPRVRVAIALDTDLEALSKGRRETVHLQAAVGDLYELPFASGQADLLFNSSTLEHLERPAMALAEMRRVVKPGGSLFVGVPYALGPLGFQRWIAGTPAGIWIGKVYAADQLERVVSSAGFKIRWTFTYFLRCFVGVLAGKEG